MWEVEGTDEFDAWYQTLTERQVGALDGRIDMLQDGGPTLGRPVVGSIQRSRHHNMKELRCSKDGALRVLFIFDPVRRAVLLLGGNKADGSAWNMWYLTAVPHADALYDAHLKQLRDEGLLP